MSPAGPVPHDARPGGLARIVLRPVGTPLLLGFLGLLLAAVAFYAALAFELEDARHRTVLPVGRRSGGRDVMTGDVQDDVRDVAHEPGVRSQL